MTTIAPSSDTTATASLPIACSLGADELSARLAAIAELGRDALLDARLDGSRARLRFGGAPGVRERVEAIAAAEASCCAFLDLDVAAEPGTGAVLLEIEAPADAELVLAELVESFGVPAA